MDFYRISRKEIKGDLPALYPDFLIKRSKDLMVRGKNFLAVWNPQLGLWSTDEYDVREMIDSHLDAYAEDLMKRTGEAYNVHYLSSNANKGWREFKNYVQILGDNGHDLDSSLTFADTPVKKEDYASKRLPYSLGEGDHSAWDELVGTLYSVEERAKIEWIIGAIVTGDSKKIDKFGVFYGDPGSGKGTILKVIRQLFAPYCVSFDAKSLGASGKDFAAEVFKDNPLVAIQDDGDLSRIEDNTKLNMIVSHEPFPLNEKYKTPRSLVLNSFLLIGTNQPVKISDAKSGLLRRLIDISPTNVLIPRAHYDALMTRVGFELGAIAHHCQQTYRSMGKNYYGNYRPLQMMFQTDITFNFIESYYDVFKGQDGTSLKQAHSLYKEYCEETGIPPSAIKAQYQLRKELDSYFDKFHDKHEMPDGTVVRFWYSGFSAAKFKAPDKDDRTFSMVLDATESIFDEVAKDWPAQYSKLDKFGNDIPAKMWNHPEHGPVTTTLSDLDTHEMHYVKIPENYIIIDFDLADVGGKKSLERNLQAASNWPPTYAELSKSGAGVHLIYDYQGDIPIEELSNEFSEGIEIKTLLGNASLRRKLTLCNAIPIAPVKTGLPRKEKKTITKHTIADEKHLRTMIEKNFKKEFDPATKPSMDFIKKLTDEAYEAGIVYDITDMQSRLLSFAMSSTNQSDYCLALIPKIHLTGKFDQEKMADEIAKIEKYANSGGDNDLVIFDIEVFPNLFVVCWKYVGSDQIQKLINPSPQEIEELLKLKLIGYNNRRYDNHILYARMLGATIEQLYLRSKKIISNDRDAMFAQAYGISYADIYDFATIKQSVKKWEIDLDIFHSELGMDWDAAVKDEDIAKVVEYCCDDIRGQEAVFIHLKADFIARKILSELSGLAVNHTTANQAARIIFGQDKEPQKKFVYTELKHQFPGYEYNRGVSTYRGEVAGEGGLVRAKPGMYHDVAVLDVESMHPSSIEILNLFGPYTEKFSDIKKARVAIKNGRYDDARTMLDGKLAPFLEDTSDDDAMKRLSDALKIVINSVYGLTSARFQNPFKDARNFDNIVAKRGALFMIDLMEFCDQQGIEWVHIKTDSIKIINATQKAIDIVIEFSSNYGYTMVHEETYEKFCLVNDAVYIAKYGWHATKPKKVGTWYAVGKQFQHKYVFKTLFSREEVTFNDLGEVRQVKQGTMYLDFQNDIPPKGTEDITEGMAFVGRIGKFVPIQDGCGGATLWRIQENKAWAVNGTKGYFWMEAHMAQSRADEIEIDMRYYEELVTAAVAQINKYGSFEEFVS